MSIFSKLFKKKQFKYSDNEFWVEFPNEFLKSDEFDKIPNDPNFFINYVSARDISPDLKVKGTKYYVGNTIISDNNFTIYIRCRYNKTGKEYRKEPLIDLLGSISDNATNRVSINKYGVVTTKDACELNLYDILNGHVDYILDDIVEEEDGTTTLKTYFSFKYYLDKNAKNVEGYVAFDKNSSNEEYVEYLKKFAISSSLK